MQKFIKGLALSNDNVAFWVNNFNLLYFHISGIENHLKMPEDCEVSWLDNNLGSVAEEILNYHFPMPVEAETENEEQ